jgi:hypothetical protein
VRRRLRSRAPLIRGILCAVLVALGLQMSGVGHVLADALDLLAELEHQDADCSDGGKECPPGCPDCHCVHMRSLVVVSAMGEPFEYATLIEFPWLVESRPKTPPEEALYRPPRA